MTSCTPIYRLPYPTGSDAPCDVDETFCSFALAVEAELERLDGIVDRVADSVPLCRVRMTSPLSINNGIGGNATLAIPFDTIDVDTANMVDLDNNRYQIQLPFFGRYIIGFQIQAAAVTSNDEVGGNMSDAIDAFISDGSTPMYLNSSASIRYLNTGSPDTTTGTLNLNYSYLSAGTITINSATAFAYWIGDLP